MITHRLTRWLHVALFVIGLSSAPPIFADPLAAPFPTTGLLPKTEIGALRFLKEHPEFDGRGVRVAIFDTGVDPGAVGLQTTPSGQPKFIDFIDTTGSGDVDLQETVKPDGNQLPGLTGRNLKLDPQWKNPEGIYRRGIKRAYELFPSALVSRLKKERKKEFLKKHRQVEAELRASVATWEDSGLKLTPTEKTHLADLRAQLKALQTLENTYEDPGPVYDVIAFNDGQRWRVVVDTDEDGDLTDEDILTNYRDEPAYDTFDEESLLNFTVRFDGDCSRASLVVASGSHGTHVAGIVAAHYENQPELNGIAPGAQIVSVKIGDTRLDGMETGSALARGVQAALDLDCDLINMSYGEPTSTPNVGDLIDVFSKAVNEKGTIFVASAGNSGPCLTTVGAPGGTTSAVIGVGAYLSPEMAATAYSLREPIPGSAYSWTSRGPTADGDFGVDIFAPGGAIAPVPPWTLNRSQRMNGTSMASPNACGAIVLLLSGLKADKIAYSPYSVRRAIQSTAEPIRTIDPFAQGPGLVQVDRAYQHLTTFADALAEDLAFRVSVSGRHHDRGIYLRERNMTDSPQEFRVQIEPAFPEATEPQTKVDFSLSFNFEPSADWISCGRHMLMTSDGGSLAVHVDPTRLRPGAYAESIAAFDATRTDRPAVFRIPITVVVPTPSDTDDPARVEQSMNFGPGDVGRLFAATPANATWANITLTLSKETSETTPVEPKRFLMQTVQLLPGRTFETAMKRNYLLLQPGEPRVISIQTTGSRLLDVSLVQDYSSLKESNVRVEVEFEGLQPDVTDLALTAGALGSPVSVTALTGKERLKPTARLDRLQRFVTPSDASIRPLSDTDSSNAEQLYELETTYEFEQSKSGKVTLRFPQTDDLLYDSPIISHLWNVHDAGGQLVASDDVFPEATQLEKGSHTLTVKFFDTDPERLEDLSAVPLVMERKLSSSISLKVYPSRTAAAAERGTVSTTRLQPGESMDLFVAAPTLSSLPSSVQPGDRLLGTIHYGEESSSSLAGRRPNGWPIACLIPANSKSPSKTNSNSSSDKPTDLAAAMRDAEIAYLKSLSSPKQDQEFETLAAKLLKSHQDKLPILLARLHRLDNEKRRKDHLPKVVDAADAVLAEIDTEALQKHFGQRLDEDDPEAVKERKKFEKLRDTLTDTLYRKGRAIGYQELPDVEEKHPVKDPKALDAAFEANFKELARWVDTTEKKWDLLHIRWLRRNERFGQALEILNRDLKDSAPDYWRLKKQRDIYEQLDWLHAADYANRWLAIRFPDRVMKTR
ncbi:S8 family serine peptidase [Thalassoroseus pseudoceratinae]|uniref:S8 family serine peptidase n=1 Tax=Thalassoroseus pseudoceratinae TaxID=2713176 RepID=UPI001423E327|nr:S8 family serine peptidase [Thalassoroseus pseudoceratinae]